MIREVLGAILNIMEHKEKIKRLVQALEENGRVSVVELSRRSRIPTSTVHTILKKFRKRKVILKYTTIFDYAKLEQEGINIIGED